MEKLVRDFVPGFAVCDPDGPGGSFRIASENEREKLLLAKIQEEAAELSENPSIEELADLMEAVGTFMNLRGWKNDDVSAARDTKRKQSGGFTRFFVLQPVV